MFTSRLAVPTVATAGLRPVACFEMGVGRFVILRRAADQLAVELAGDLSEHTLVTCEAEARAQLSVAKPGVKVLIDLVGVHGYSLEARDALVALQRHLASKAGQTAYVAVTAAGRGLALWVSHMSENQVIKSFSRRDDAEAWLAGIAGPTTGVCPVTRALDRDPPRPRKKASQG
jgi:hypothetical protein